MNTVCNYTVEKLVYLFVGASYVYRVFRMISDTEYIVHLNQYSIEIILSDKKIQGRRKREKEFAYLILQKRNIPT